jgi:hypothetical protein
MRLTAIGWSLASAPLVLWVGLAWAQQATQPAPRPANQPLTLDLPPPADTGKARYFAPPDLPPSLGCAAVLDCRLRVIGALQHNGAVELNGALLKW